MSGAVDDAGRSALIEGVGRELIANELRAGREVRFRASGTSMLPAVWPGDLLVARPIAAEDIAVGELLVFLRDGRLVVHRIVEREEHGGVPRFVTRGDTLGQCDPPVQPAQILGAVTAIVRNGRQLSTNLRRPSLAVRLMSYGVPRSHLFRRALLRVHAWLAGKGDSPAGDSGGLTGLSRFAGRNASGHQIFLLCRRLRQRRRVRVLQQRRQ